ncbi:alpha/beta fold hydrolase [Seohaeicola saemankumensis]|uniref:Alpha/beta fold hydrolase n=1 Tax=Seohaeicola saemankumensis TaxID=481181 RepID=A0ABW3TD35_9RHOB
MRYRFSDCVLDTVSHSFTRDGETIPLEPQVFDLLHLLAERAGELVTKDELIEAVWNGRIVSEATISSRINAARSAVGDTGKDQRIIRTIPRRGFELMVDASQEPVSADAADGLVTQTVRYTSSVDDTQIAYAISGTGPPLMRAGHFLTHLEKDARNSVFRSSIEMFSAHHKLIRYDQRGTGLSQTDVEELSIEAYANDLLAVADAVGLDRFPIFATSQGVPIAIHFAATHPSRVSRLVLCGGFAQGRMVRDDNYSREEAEVLMTLVRMGWGKPDSAFMSAFISMFCPDASRAERASLVESQLASATAEMAARVRMTIDKFNVVDLLGQVQAPTLVIHASGDALHPVSQGRLLASKIPAAEFRLVESNNHIFLKSTPAWDEIMSAALEFLGRDKV